VLWNTTPDVRIGVLSTNRPCTVAVLDIEPFGAIIRGGNTRERSAMFQVISRQFVPQELQYSLLLYGICHACQACCRYIAEAFNCLADGITLSSKQSQRANELSAAAGLADRCVFQVGDALDQPFVDNSFDLVWSLESGEHMPDKRHVLGPVKLQLQRLYFACMFLGMHGVWIT
jgi:hypothetical protein